MALVNLLPWREELRQEKKKEFLSILMLVLIVAGALAFGWYKVVDSQISSQQERNNQLKKGITHLDRELDRIKNLEQTRKQWLARMDVIQGLQGNRAEIVRIFDQFARAVPDGVFLSEMKFINESTITLVGFAESNSRVTTLMRQLSNSSKFTNTDLPKIEKDGTLGEQGSRFEIKMSVVKPEALVESDSAEGEKG